MRILLIFIFLPSVLISQEIDSGKVYKSLELALENPEEVFHLNLKAQRLDSIPAGVFQLTSLKTLILKRNRIQRIPAEIKNLQKLEVLNLSGNRIAELPLDMFELKVLKELRLGKNELLIIPSEVNRLQELQIFDAWSNRLANLPTEFGDLKKLNFIDLRVNPISEENQNYIRDLTPYVKVNMSLSCNCY